MSHLREAAHKDYPKASEHALAEMVAEGSLTFFFVHEVGHAMIDLFHLHFTGREEDVADQIAAFQLLGNQPPALTDHFISGVLWFFEKGDRTQPPEEAFADEHSFDKQRFYNVMCWVYGKDTQRYNYLRTRLGARADRCSEEYEKMADGIKALLAPHMDYAAAYNRKLGNASVFELRIGQKYFHPKHGFFVLFNGSDLVAASSGPAPERLWRLHDFPERQWGTISAMGRGNQLAVLRNGHQLFAKWLE